MLPVFVCNTLALCIFEASKSVPTNSTSGDVWQIFKPYFLNVRARCASYRSCASGKYLVRSSELQEHANRYAIIQTLTQ